MTKAKDIQIQFVPIELCEFNEGQIPGVPENPRTREDSRQKSLEKSIEELPEMTVARAALCYKYNGKYVVIGGNRRLEAQIALKRKSIPVIALPEDIPMAKLRRIALLDNESTGQTDWNKLAKDWDIAEIESWNIATPKGWEKLTSPEAKDDNYTPPSDVEPRVKYGEVWQLGEHRLMCGNSSIKKDMQNLMNGVYADMVFTDPPYGVAIGDKNKVLNSVQESGRCTENIANDNIPIDELYSILVKAMTNCRESCKDSASYYITSPQGGELGLMMMMMMKEAGLPVRHILIWEKNSPTFSLGRLDYDYQHEPIFYTWTRSHHNYRNGDFRSTIWKYNKPLKCNLHPTMKPVELVANCMKDASQSGDIVLDIFGGSGTSIIAAEQLGRKCYMMEIDPKYCDVIINRWETLTGQKAHKIE